MTKIIIVYYERNQLNLHEEIDIEIEVLNFDDKFLQTLNKFMCEVAEEYTDTTDEAELLDYFENNYIYELRPLNCNCPKFFALILVSCMIMMI